MNTPHYNQSGSKRAFAVYAWLRFAFPSTHTWDNILDHWVAKKAVRWGLSGCLDFINVRPNLGPTGNPEIMALFKDELYLPIPSSVRLYFSIEGSPNSPTHWILISKDARGFWLPEKSGSVYEAKPDGPAGFWFRPKLSPERLDGRRLAAGELGVDIDFVPWNTYGRKPVKRVPQRIAQAAIDQYLWYRPQATSVTVACDITQEMYDYDAVLQRYTLTGERLGRSKRRKDGTYMSSEPEYKAGMPTFGLTHHDWGTQMSLWIAPNLFTRFHASIPDEVHAKLAPLAAEYSTGTFMYKGWPLMLGACGSMFPAPHDREPVITFDPAEVFRPDSVHHRRWDFYVAKYALHLDDEGNLTSR